MGVNPDRRLTALERMQLRMAIADGLSSHELADMFRCYVATFNN